MRQKGVERGIIHRCDHLDGLVLRSALDDEGPRFLGPGFEFVAHALPAQGILLVLPRHRDVPAREVGPVLADLGDTQGEAASLLFSHGKGDRLLGATGFSPEALHDFVAMLDFNEGASRFVARAPDGFEGFSRLEGPVFSGEMMGNADGEGL